MKEQRSLNLGYQTALQRYGRLVRDQVGGNQLGHCISGLVVTSVGYRTLVDAWLIGWLELVIAVYLRS